MLVHDVVELDLGRLAVHVAPQVLEPVDVQHLGPRRARREEAHPEPQVQRHVQQVTLRQRALYLAGKRLPEGAQPAHARRVAEEAHARVAVHHAERPHGRLRRARRLRVVEHRRAHSAPLDGARPRAQQRAHGLGAVRRVAALGRVKLAAIDEQHAHAIRVVPAPPRPAPTRVHQRILLPLGAQRDVDCHRLLRRGVANHAHAGHRRVLRARVPPRRHLLALHTQNLTGLRRAA
mmetsp:Transcript_18165/g.56351  ORF Transcript_18165/g.56351 Transcript_18165/m.56351 type:complete len:234 (-) Transcript_18165:185-886(-)